MDKTATFYRYPSLMSESRSSFFVLFSWWREAFCNFIFTKEKYADMIILYHKNKFILVVWVYSILLRIWSKVLFPYWQNEIFVQASKVRLSSFLSLSRIEVRNLCPSNQFQKSSTSLRQHISTAYSFSNLFCVCDREKRLIQYMAHYQ